RNAVAGRAEVVAQVAGAGAAGRPERDAGAIGVPEEAGRRYGTSSTGTGSTGTGTGVIGPGRDVPGRHRFLLSRVGRRQRLAHRDRPQPSQSVEERPERLAEGDRLADVLALDEPAHRRPGALLPFRL